MTLCYVQISTTGVSDNKMFIKHVKDNFETKPNLNKTNILHFPGCTTGRLEKARTDKFFFIPKKFDKYMNSKSFTQIEHHKTNISLITCE